MAVVDSLEVDIQAKSDSASKSLDDLVRKLGLVTEGISAIGKNSGLEDFAKKAQEATKGFASIQNMGKTISANIEPQMQKVAKSLKEITAKYKDLGKGFTFSGSDTAIQKQIEKYTNALENARLKKQELELSGKTEGQAYEDAVKNVLKYTNVIESLNTQLGSVQTPYIDLSKLNQEEFTNWLKNLPSIAQQATQSVSTSFNQIEIPKIEPINAESLNYNANAMKAVFGEAAAQIQNYAEAVRQFGQQAEEALNTGAKTNLSQMSAKELDEWFNNLPSVKAQVEQTALDINTALNQIEKPRTINISAESLNYNEELMKAVYGEATDGIRNFQDAVQSFGEQAGKVLNEPMSKIKEFRERLNHLEIPPIREDNLKKLQSSLEKTEAKLEELRAKLSNGLEIGSITESVDDKGYVKLQEQIALTEKQAEALRAKIQEVEQQSKTNWAESLSKAMGKVSSFAKQAHKSLSKISTILKKIDNGINKTVGKITSLGKAFTSVSKSSKKSEISLSKAFKMILRYGLGIRSVYTLINKMRRAIIDGFKNLAQYSNEVNHSISMLKGSLETLKNSSAAALSPLLNAMAPALNTIIQLCIRATNAINQFLSALFGKETWIKAKDQITDYADSIADAAKEAKNGARVFDELKMISTDSGGGAGGTESGADTFETLPINSNISDMAEKAKSILKDFFKPLKEAWDSEGGLVMNSWKYALDEIWKLVKDIGRDFLIVWNQKETIAMFEDVLRIIGDIGITVGNLAKNFREAWNTNEIGLHIFENIRDIIGAVTENIRRAADYTVEWSKTLDFYPVLEKIEQWTKSLVPAFDSLSGIVSDFYTKVLLPLGKWTLEEGLPKLLQVFIDFNNKVDWASLRTRLSEFWEHLEPFAETVGEGLIIFIDRVSNALANFLNSETFVNFLHDLEDWMVNVTPEDVADGIEKLAKAFVAFKLSMAAFKVGGVIAKSLTFLLDNLSALKALGEIALVVTIAIEGFEIGKGLGKLLNPEDSEWYDNFKFFGEDGFFDIVIPDTTDFSTFVSDLQTDLIAFQKMATDFENNPAVASLTDALIGPFASAALNVPNKVSEISQSLKKTEDAFGETKSAITLWKDDIYNAFVTLGERQSETFEKIKTNVSGTLDNIKENASIAFENVKTTILNAWENTKTDTNAAWEILKENLSETWKTLETNATEKFENIKANISEKWGSLKADTSEKWENVKSSLLDTWEELKGNAGDKFNEIKTSISDIWGKLKENTSQMWQGIKEVIKKPINAIIGFINGMINGVVGGVNTVINALNKLKIEIPEWLSNVPGASSIAGKTFGFDLSNITAPSIPYLAKGGIVMNYTPAIIGEAGAEAILPLTDSRSMNMIADSIVSNIDYNNGISGGYGLSEQQIYNIVYNAVGAAIANSKLLNDQKDAVKGILQKPTMEISGLGRELAKDAWIKGRNTGRGGMRLAVAQELY